jgi:hypothetical protein
MLDLSVADAVKNRIAGPGQRYIGRFRFLQPGATARALRTLDPEWELLLCTTITVTTHRLYVGGHTGSRACRIILVEGSKRLVSEDELLAALDDPRPPGSN